MLGKYVYVAALITFSLGAIAQKPGGTTTFYPAKPLPGVTPDAPMMQMPSAIPLFVTGGNFSSTLTLVNVSTSNTYADVTVRALNGSTIATKRVDFAPHSQQKVDVSQLLSARGSSLVTGSILVMQSADLMGPTILATLGMTYLGSADRNFIDEEIFMPDTKGSQVLQGVADRGDGSPIVAVSSLAEMAQHVTVQCLGIQGASEARQISLAAGQTMVLDACASSEIRETDFASTSEHATDEKRGPVGIKLSSDAMPGSFAAFALVPHGNYGERSFSSVLFSDPKSLHSSNTVFTGVPVGSTTLLPGTYTPQISLTNFSASEIHVHTSFAQTSGSNAVTHEVGSITMRPGTSRELVLNDLEGDPALQNSFVVFSDGAPGALMAKLVSKSDSRLPQVELQAKDALDGNNSGGHPWSIKQGIESTLLLFNHGDKAQVFTVSISGSDVWQKSYTLAPMQTKAVNVRSLIENHIKDDNGKTLPEAVSTGEISWLAADTTKVSGRLLQSNRSTGMARNFSCGWSGLLCGAKLVTYTATFPDGEIVSYGLVTAITCTSGTQNACSGQPTGTGGSFNTSWFSQSPNVASIYGGNTSSNVSLQAMSGGSSNVYGTMTSSYCQASGGGPVTVQVPTALRVVQTTSNGAASCPPGQAGWQRVVDRAVVDQTGQDIKVDNQTIGETITLVQAGLGNGPIVTGTGTTDGNGQYPDIFQICSSLCPGSTNTNTATQTNSDTVPSVATPYQLTNSTIQYACKNIKINGALTP